MEEVILPIVYLGNINYYNALLNNRDNVVFDKHEHYVKQSYHNRTEIYGANGKLMLSVPLEKRVKRTPMKDVKISYNDPWRKLHWRSLESAYRSSPYFEYYESQLEPFYFGEKYKYLVDFNIAIQDAVLTLLNTSIENTYTSEYKPIEGFDFRKNINPRITPDKAYPSQEYIQVFQDREGYIPNLSILDLLFSEGPNAISFLQK